MWSDDRRGLAMDHEPPTHSRGPLIVLSGPSGVGKSTVVDRVIATSGLNLRRAVTATTREPRPGERPEIDYHYWTRDRFETALATGEMLEHAVVHGRDYYGTPRMEVDPYRERGAGVVLVIDVQGAATVRKLYDGDHVSVFLDPPTFEDLEARLRGRGEKEESIRRRLETARREFDRRGEFDRHVLNGDLEVAAKDLEAIIREQFTPRVSTCSTN